MAIVGSVPSPLHETLVEMFSDILFAVLPAALRHHLEARMKTAEEKYVSAFARRYHGQGLAEGQAAGQARAVLQVLEAGGIPVESAARLSVEPARDVEQLAEWLRRALVVSSTDELFA